VSLQQESEAVMDERGDDIKAVEALIAAARGRPGDWTVF
jgi:hypothetical protein